MPTENRSTMVSVPRELLERLDLGKNTATAMSALPELRALLAQPAQHQGEPVALPEHAAYITVSNPTGRGNEYSFDWAMGAEALDEGEHKLYTHPAPADQRESAEKRKLHIEVRECESCNHIGIDDAHRTLAACHECDWSGPEPIEDKCPGCERENVMAAACPDCGSRYVLATSKTIEVLADPGEVERLRAQLAEQGALLNDIAKRHWSGVDFDLPADLVDRLPVLSASEEPVAPVERDERAMTKAFHDWAFYKKGEAIGRMDGQQAALEGFIAGADWQARAALERKP